MGRSATTFEATPEYLYTPTCAERIHRYNPNLKLIVLLRNPIDRAFSGWNMFRNLVVNRPKYLQKRVATANPAVRTAMLALLNEPFPDFDTAIRREIDAPNHPEPSYIRRGYYAEQLQRYFDRFPRNQLLILESTQLKNDTRNTLANVVRFLDVPTFTWQDEMLKPRHVGSYAKGEISAETRQFLRDRFAPHNARLYQMLGTDFNWS